MNKVISIVILFVLLLLPVVVGADAGVNGHVRSVADVVSEIAAGQTVSSQGDISCGDVTNEQFEELGDAVMQVMIGDDEQHELMDNMMGGEGSASLQAMHVGMGQRYLGCAQGQFGTMGMMGGMLSMMGVGWQGGDGTMMGNFGSWGMAGAGMVLFWIVIIVGVGLFVAWLSRQQNTDSKNRSALDILKERYAKGEINKEEFEIKRKDLNA